ncbi:MAG: serine hydrolase domain-containing protein, partial [Oscillospiraceae bacterium]
GDPRLAFPHTPQQGKRSSFEGAAAPLPLPRSTPEEMGLSSYNLEKFYRSVAGIPGTNLHSILVLRHGQVVSEAYFNPFKKDVWHVTHSLCKTFTGTATGLAIAEGLFGLDDSVADYFSDKIHFYNLKKYKPITVRHLLAMASGISFNEISQAVEEDWLRGIFSTDLAFTPGSKFVYNSMNSYLLAALVNRASGQSVTEYLAPRIFEPLGFGPVAWEQSAAGVEKGGWGMYLAPEDMAKFGLLYLQRGRWNTGEKARQLIPESWVQEASTTKITGANGDEYGYQMWTDSTTGTFTMNGMFGQYITGFPSLDILVVMTAGNANLLRQSAVYTLMQQHFYPLSPGAALPPNPGALHSLQYTLANLKNQQPAPAPGPRHAVFEKSGYNWRKTPQKQFLTRGALPAGTEAFCGTTWHFGKNAAALLPVVMQAMNNNFSTGVNALRIEKNGSLLDFYWEENERTLFFSAGFAAAVETTLTLGSESFLTAGGVQLCTDEDSRPVLKLVLNFLEYSSCRVLKFSLQGKNILLRANETPSLSIAMETALSQNTATGGDRSSGLDKLKNNEFLLYKLAQLCAPEVMGKPYIAPYEGR